MGYDVNPNSINIVFFCIDNVYNNWILFTFIFSILVIINTKFDLSGKLAENLGVKDSLFHKYEFNSKILIWSIIIGNFIMFFLQFLSDPFYHYINCFTP